MNNPELLNEIVAVGNTILKVTTPENILIFIGQTPHYYAPIVAKHRRVICVAFSGRAYQDEWSIPSKSNLNAYKIYLESIGITQQFFHENFNNIILVDHTHSGKSPICFLKTLEGVLGHLHDHQHHQPSLSTMRFINLISSSQAKYDVAWIKDTPTKYLKTIGYVVSPNLTAFANESAPTISGDTLDFKIPRSIPSYPHFKWHIPLDKLQSDLTEGKMFLNTIEKYYAKHEHQSASALVAAFASALGGAAAFAGAAYASANAEVYFKLYKRRIKFTVENNEMDIKREKYNQYIPSIEICRHASLPLKM